jgi:hypothetical protein
MVVVPEDRSGQVLASFAEEKQHYLVTMKKKRYKQNYI